MRHVLDALEAKFPKAAEHLDAAQHELLAFTAFPREIWRQIWSNNPPLRRDPPGRRRLGRAERRVDRGPPLHGPRIARQGPPAPDRGRNR
jgi:hypothetical protein